MEYTVKTINELCTKITDGSHFSPEHETNGQYPMYSVKDMEYNNFSNADCKMIGQAMFEKLSKTDCRPLKNDILIAKDGSYLKCAFKVNEDLNACILSSIAILRPNLKNIDPDYFVYLMRTKSIKGAMANYVSGSALPRIILSDFKKMKLKMISSLPTQQKIASILSAYDDLIQNYKKQIQALQTAASELYKEWFVRFRFPGYQTTNFENGIPEGWKVYRIKDLCYINKKTVSSKDAKKEILYLDTGSITENVIDSFESYILEEAPSRARRIVKKNSIIFSTVRPNQNHYGILKTVPENLIVSTGFAVFDPKFDIANILYFFLSSKDFVDYCQMIAEGAVATYPSIKPEEIGKVKILLPTMDLAIKLNHSFESLFLRIENLKQQITNLTQQRDLLLPRLMSGKLEV